MCHPLPPPPLLSVMWAASMTRCWSTASSTSPWTRRTGASSLWTILMTVSQVFVCCNLYVPPSPPPLSYVGSFYDEVLKYCQQYITLDKEDRGLTVSQVILCCMCHLLPPSQSRGQLPWRGAEVLPAVRHPGQGGQGPHPCGRFWWRCRR